MQGLPQFFCCHKARPLPAGRSLSTPTCLVFALLSSHCIGACGRLLWPAQMDVSFTKPGAWHSPGSHVVALFVRSARDSSPTEQKVRLSVARLARESFCRDTTVSKRTNTRDPSRTTDKNIAFMQKSLDLRCSAGISCVTCVIHDPF